MLRLARPVNQNGFFKLFLSSPRRHFAIDESGARSVKQLTAYLNEYGPGRAPGAQHGPPGIIITSGAFLMGMAFHADLNKDVVSDTLWAVAAYLEVLALIPALVAARAGQQQSLEFARAIALCRVFSLGFWSQAFAELKARSGSAYVGVVVLAVETVAVVLAVELLAAASPKGRNKKN